MRRFLAGCLAVSMLAAVGCSSKSTDNTTKPSDSNTTPKKDQVVRINIGTEPKGLDPSVTTGMPEANVQLSLFEGLMRLDKDGHAVPGIASSVDTKDNGATFVFHLRDAKWSNGDPITADDFVWSWKRALDPALASEYAYQLYYIKGAEKMNTVPVNELEADGKTEKKGTDGKAIPRKPEDIKKDFEAAAKDFGVKVIDPKTLEVDLAAPTPYFLSLTAFHTLYPVNRKTVEAHPTDWFRNPDTMIVDGPFKMQSWTAKDKIILVKNPNYYDVAKVKLDRIEYYLIESETTATTMYESGQLDVVESGVNNAELDRLKKDHPNDLLFLPDLGTYFYRFNVTKAPLNDVRVRKALTLAIDRQAIIDNVVKGGQKPALAYTPNGIPDVTGDYRGNGGTFYKDNDVATAKKLLADAGFPDGKGFPKLTIMYNTSEGHQHIAEAIQEMWKKNLGIDIQLQNQEWQVYLDNESKLNYDIARAGWIGDYVDPMTFMDMFVTNGGNNETGWSNANFDKLIDTAKKSGDAKVRMQSMHDAEKILMDEMPVMPIYFYVRLRFVSPHVKGWAEPLTSGFDLREAYVE